jgi:hypothetical protein
MADDIAPLLLALPSELIHHILSFLSLSDLLSIGLVNHALHQHSLQDTLYQPFVQSHAPGQTIPNPPNSSWRDTFKLHHPYWFIPKNKIWFADSPHTGKLLIARYDHRLNAIEAYALVAERRQPTFQYWEWNPDAIIHTFNPRVRLDLNAPVIRLDAESYDRAIGEVGYHLQKEIPMDVFNKSLHSTAALYSRLMLARPWPAHRIAKTTPVWPPLTVPSTSRSRTDSPSHFRDTGNRPAKMSELSTSNFRIRKWMEFSSRPYGVSMRVGEDITTWGTLPEECYTPTREKPWQGIWCGDYAGHGCEFLVVMQPDDPQPLPEKAYWTMKARERDGSVSSDGSWSTAPTHAAEWEEALAELTHSPVEDSEMSLGGSISTLRQTRSESSGSDLDYHDMKEDQAIYRGRIEAVKLTGDPNIPRGEYSFIAPDIGPNGLIRVATEELFKGARIVKSVGHIAARGFRDGEYLQVYFRTEKTDRDRRLHGIAAHTYLARSLGAVLGDVWPCFFLPTGQH